MNIISEFHNQPSPCPYTITRSRHSRMYYTTLQAVLYHGALYSEAQSILYGVGQSCSYISVLSHTSVTVSAHPGEIRAAWILRAVSLYSRLYNIQAVLLQFLVYFYTLGSMHFQKKTWNFSKLHFLLQLTFKLYCFFIYP